MAEKNPLCLYDGEIKELQSGDSLPLSPEKVGTASLAFTFGNTIQTYTATGDTTFTDSLSDGQYITLLIFGGDSHVITFPTLTWCGAGGNLAPVLTSADIIVFFKVGSTLYGVYSGSAE